MANPCTELLEGLRAFLETRDDPTVEDFRADFDWSMRMRTLAERSLPCLRHLPRTAAIAAPDTRRLAGILLRSSPRLAWGQTYAASDFGARFLDNYGWTELFGTRGHFACDRMAGGFLLLGPGIEYPDHHHVAEEVYVPLTGGTEWRKGAAPYAPRAAGSVIHHPSNVSHAMRTGAEPLLALYLWRGGPLAQKSSIGMSPGSGA